MKSVPKSLLQACIKHNRLAKESVALKTTDTRKVIRSPNKKQDMQNRISCFLFTNQERFSFSADASASSESPERLTSFKKFLPAVEC